MAAEEAARGHEEKWKKVGVVHYSWPCTDWGAHGTTVSGDVERDGGELAEDDVINLLRRSARHPHEYCAEFYNTSHASEEPERGSAAEDDHLVTLRTAR